LLVDAPRISNLGEIGGDTVIGRGIVAKYFIQKCLHLIWS